MGEPMTFDEGLEYFVSQRPDKDALLKGSGANGSGGHAGNQAGGGTQEPLSSHDKIKAGLEARQ
jgi:hypothetical protein